MYRRITHLIFLLISIIFLFGSCCDLMNPGEENLLTDGLSDWQQVGGRPGSWKFEDGVLFTEADAGGWLSTKQQYSDFRMQLEFRISPGGNSGVFLRSPHKGDPAYEGLEIQLLDDYAQEYAGLRPAQYTGSIYDIQPPSERASKNAGQWQKMIIQCIGKKVTVDLNGKRIISANLEQYSDKLGSHPGLLRSEGFVGLQNHGSTVEFRNINIRKCK
jgi:hypothetical protein